MALWIGAVKCWFILQEKSNFIILWVVFEISWLLTWVEGAWSSMKHRMVAQSWHRYIIVVFWTGHCLRKAIISILNGYGCLHGNVLEIMRKWKKIKFKFFIPCFNKDFLCLREVLYVVQCFALDLEGTTLKSLAPHPAALDFVCIHPVSSSWSDIYE